MRGMPLPQDKQLHYMLQIRQGYSCRFLHGVFHARSYSLRIRSCSLLCCSGRRFLLATSSPQSPCRERCTGGYQRSTDTLNQPAFSETARPGLIFPRIGSINRAASQFTPKARIRMNGILTASMSSPRALPSNTNWLTRNPTCQCSRKIG